MKITFSAEELHKRFTKELRSRQGAKRHPANSVKLGVLVDNANLTATLVNELPPYHIDQDALKVEFLPSSDKRHVYARVDASKIGGVPFYYGDGDAELFDRFDCAELVEGNLSLYGNLPLHRLLVTLHLGIGLHGLEVHHIDLNPHNNSIENLLITNKQTHDRGHYLIGKDLEVLKEKEPSIYASFTMQRTLESLQEEYSNLHLVITTKPPSSSYLQMRKNKGVEPLKGRINLAKLMALPVDVDLRDGSNLRRFEVPAGYAAGMASILRALHSKVGLPGLKSPDAAPWLKKSEILSLVRLEKVGQSYSVETFERWLMALVTCQMVEPGSSAKTGKSNGYYRLTWNAYTSPRA